MQGGAANIPPSLMLAAKAVAMQAVPYLHLWRQILHEPRMLLDLLQRDAPLGMHHKDPRQQVQAGAGQSYIRRDAVLPQSNALQQQAAIACKVVKCSTSQPEAGPKRHNSNSNNNQNDAVVAWREVCTCYCP